MADQIRLIKKYPNRRLYDTQTSSYITLADVKELVLEHGSFQVVDAKSGEDLTRNILLQIILEEEAGGAPMFTSDLLSQMIRFYGNAMQGLMGNFLDKNLQLFVQMQGKMTEQAESVMKGETSPFTNPGVWGEFMKFQGPALQKMMGDYMESGASMFMQMQQQMQQQAKEVFDSSAQQESEAPAAARKPATKS